MFVLDYTYMPIYKDQMDQTKTTKGCQCKIFSTVLCLWLRSIELRNTEDAAQPTNLVTCLDGAAIPYLEA